MGKGAGHTVFEVKRQMKEKRRRKPAHKEVKITI